MFQKKFFSYCIQKKGWNKVDPRIRNAKHVSFGKMLLSFIRSAGNSAYKICDLLGIKLLTGLRLDFSHLSEHKFRHSFADLLNPLCSCFSETKSTQPAITCSKLTIETLEQDVKYVQS